ncbi:LCP family protein [Treponema endosymbiont of Eucomonympha sp.]|uniref:LCP family protein n=1 Tax=Treponema endosymbiont of Eucomonympha sp. TaxID=1580831 RepID=UPI000750F047|nr:LytR C-terminal domain-containing protein [Treponema endosymbiont of Eucomonympha sp.]
MDRFEVKTIERKRKGLPRKTGTPLLIVILFVLAGSGALFFRLIRIDPVAEVIKNNGVIKVLFLLKKKKQLLSSNVLFYYPQNKRGAVFTIPGNTGKRYNALKQRTDRISAVFAECDLQSYRREAEILLGQPFSFTVEITLDSLYALADLLGGLRVFVPKNIAAEGKSGECLLMPLGTIELKGEKVRTYADYIFGSENEADAQARWQDLVMSLLNALSENQHLIRDKHAFSLIANCMTTDLNRNDLQHLLAEIAELNFNRLTPQTITGDIQQAGAKSLLFPHYQGQLIKDIVKQTLDTLVLHGEVSRSFVLEIKNGTTRRELARNTADFLQNIGYDVLRVRNADSDDYAHTVIIDRAGNAEAAKRLGEFLRCTNISTESAESGGADIGTASPVDFTLILGRDFNGRYVRR